MSVSGSKTVRGGQAKSGAIAFYDLGGTLTDLSLTQAILFLLGNIAEWRGRLGSLLSFAARAPWLYGMREEDAQVRARFLVESLRGLSADRIVQLGEEYCDRVLLARQFPQAIEMIEANRKIGLDPVLVTEWPEVIVSPLAERLHIAHFAANRLIVSREHATGRLAAPIIAGQEKAHWCVEFAKHRGLALQRCWGYADSYDDVPFLSALGHPVAVNADRRLRAAALGEQWPLLAFKNPHQTAPDSLFGGIFEFSGRTSDGAS
jgi:HAD superfamily hydrolase (TIGR01490 family)